MHVLGMMLSSTLETIRYNHTCARSVELNTCVPDFLPVPGSRFPVRSFKVEKKEIHPPVGHLCPVAHRIAYRISLIAKYCDTIVTLKHIFSAASTLDIANNFKVPRIRRQNSALAVFHSFDNSVNFLLPAIFSPSIDRLRR